mmetsp:Transcript_115791/g.327525  ORF Transcript_115791/g.327525 Transcript_115791/m.327525 type:complete len:261 (-) Transcript_115791:32-814(-)
MGLRDEELFDPAMVSTALRCPVCAMVFDDPVYCGGQPCEHVFCRGCLAHAVVNLEDFHPSSPSSVVSLSDERACACTQCPVCQVWVREEQLRPHLVLRSLLDELQVHCARSCGWVGRRDARASHALSCPVAQLEAARALVAERDRVILALETERSQRAERLEAQAHDQRVLERDARISELEGSIVRRDRQLIGLGRQLLEREVRIRNLQEQVKEQDIYAAAMAGVVASDHPRSPNAREPVSVLRTRSSLEDVIAGSDLDM